jgi:hypothetical protein
MDAVRLKQFSVAHGVLDKAEGFPDETAPCALARNPQNGRSGCAPVGQRSA